MSIKGLHELIEILSECESVAGKMETGEVPLDKALAQIANLMIKFQEIADKSGLVALKRTGREIEKFARRTDLSPEELTGLAFAFTTLKSGLKSETIEDIRAAILETYEILGFPVPTEWQVSKFVIKEDKPESDEAKTTPAETEAVEPAHEGVEEETYESVSRAADNLGLEVKTAPDGKSVVITVPSDKLPQVQRLLTPVDPQKDFSEKVPPKDELERKVLNKMKEFIAAFAEGDFKKAQEVLEDLASMQEGGEIFNEIGFMARQLYNALKELGTIIDPALKELAVDYLPDSESRLEYLMRLTEEVANTTLDCTERMQDRLEKLEELIKALQLHLERLKPIGERARQRFQQLDSIFAEIAEMSKEEKEDIKKILSAQNFQDLSGQTVLKVMEVLKELQERLIALIKSFGVKLESRKKKDELLGPAHEKMEGALKSQDEVDALLAQFGF